MGYTAVVLLVAICLHVGECSSRDSSSSEVAVMSNESSKAVFTNLVVRRIARLWNWIKDQSRTDDTFIGRCFGIGRKLKFVMPLLIFVLGIIVTTLKFLTIFSLKGLAIGVLLLLLNVGGLFGKLGAALYAHKSEPAHHPPQNVHFHVHNKDAGGHYDVEPQSSGYGWSDRVSEGLSKTTSLAEKLELLNLYKRLGFNVNGLNLNIS